MRQIVLLSLAALCLAGCGKSASERMAEAAIEAQTGQKTEIDADKGEVKITTEQGEMKINTGGNTELPAAFPKDVYLPDSYTVETSMEMPNVVVANLLTSGDASTVATAADKQMQAQGWKSSAMMQSEEGKVLMYEKDGRHATLSIAAGDEKGVSVSYQLATGQQ